MNHLFKLFCILLTALLHVHLSMYTVENVINPCFWVFTIFESASCNCIWGQIASYIIVIGIQCFVTSLLSFYIAKWNKIHIWFVAYIICVPIYFLFKFCDFATLSNALSQWYLEKYHYNAFPDILRLCIIQTIYITIYFFLSKRNYRFWIIHFLLKYFVLWNKRNTFAQY